MDTFFEAIGVIVVSSVIGVIGASLIIKVAKNLLKGKDE